MLGIAAAVCAVLAMSGPADAAKKKRSIQLDVPFSGCAYWAPPACVMVGNYNVTGSGIVPGTNVTGFGKRGQAHYCPGTPLKVTTFKVQSACWWPWWPWPR
jgi:hypothetical protein